MGRGKKGRPAADVVVLKLRASRRHLGPGPKHESVTLPLDSGNDRSLNPFNYFYRGGLRSWERHEQHHLWKQGETMQQHRVRGGKSACTLICVEGEGFVTCDGGK